MDSIITTSDSKPDLGPAVLVVSWLFAALAIIIVATRFWISRTIIRNRYTISDWIILLTLALALCNSSILTVSVYWGLGKNIRSLTPEKIMQTIKWVYFSEFFIIMCPCFGRISYASLLLKIIPPSAWRRRFLWTVIGGQSLVSVGAVIITYAQCRPTRKFWNEKEKGTCWNPVIQQDAIFFVGSLSAVADFVLAVFPTSLFWNLKMERKVKFSLSSMMGLGIFAMITSIVKTVEVKVLTKKANVTHDVAVPAIWSTIELYLVILAASIPTLRPIFRRTGNAAISSDRRTNKKTNTWALEQYRSKPQDPINGSSVSEEALFSQPPKTTPSSGQEIFGYEAVSKQ